MGADSILATQIDALSREISLGLGVEMAKVDAVPLDIRNITTPSSQAYKHFLKGQQAYSVMAFADVKKEMEKVLEIDPTFARAYVYLTYSNFLLGDPKAVNETMEKAMAFSDPTSEKDRLYLEATYAYFIERDPGKQEALLKELIRKYPKEKFAYHYLGDFYYAERRDYVEACNQYQKWLGLDPQDTFALTHLLMATIPLRDFKKAQQYIKMRKAIGPPDAAFLRWQSNMYMQMGQLDQAITIRKQSLEIDHDARDAISSVANLSRLYALKEDYEESMRLAEENVSRASSDSARAGVYSTRGLYRYWRGEIKKALDDFAQAETAAEGVENWSRKAAAAEWKGIVYVALNQVELSRKCFDDAVRIVEEHLPADVPIQKAHAALWMGYLAIKQGEIGQAEAGLAELGSFLSKLDQRTQNELNFWHDLLQGEVFLAHGSLDAALAVSQKACQPGSPFLDDSVYFRDLLAKVYAQRGEVDRAIVEYKRLVKRDVSTDAATPEYEPPLKPMGAGYLAYLIHPLYHHRLGLLYEKRGDVGKASVQYEKFLDLWKNADPSRPEIEDARKRLAGLKAQ